MKVKNMADGTKITNMAETYTRGRRDQRGKIKIEHETKVATLPA